MTSIMRDLVLLNIVMLTDLENQHIHLVNNSISKNSDKFHEKIIAEDGTEIEDCMWSMAQLSAYMQYTARVRGVGDTSANGGKGEDVFSTRCKQRMRDIAKYASCVHRELSKLEKIHGNFTAMTLWLMRLSPLAH